MLGLVLGCQVGDELGGSDFNGMGGPELGTVVDTSESRNSWYTSCIDGLTDVSLSCA